jgi:tetratricopeptide (TPR) repeat protein
VHRTVTRSLVWLATSALIPLLAACGAKPADSAPVAMAMVPGTAKVPITTASNDAKAHYIKGRGLADQLRLHDARAEFAQAATLDPAFAMAYYNLALCAPTAKEFFAQLNRAVALADQASEGERLMILALQAGANADPAKALETAQRLVARYPQDERAHFILGNAYVGHTQYAEAIGEYRRAIEIDSSYSPAYNSLGYAYRPVNNNADAEAAFKKYIALVPDDPNPYDSYAELLMKTGRFDESIAQYRKALAIDPHFGSSHIGIAVDQMFAGNTDGAIAEAQRYYDAGRDDGERRNALFTQVLIDVDAGRTAKALQRMTAEHAIAARIADTAAMSADLTAMGDILLDAGRPDEARARYTEAYALLRASSLSTDVKDDAKLANDYDLARVALAKHDRPTATALAGDYLSGAQTRHNDIRVRQAHTLAGTIALDAKQFDQALAELAQANQQNPYVLYLTALAYQASGQTAKASALFRQAADMHTLPTLQYVFIRRKAKAVV